MKSSRKISRRQFLYESNCAAVGTASLFSSLFTLRLTAGTVSGSAPQGYKAMVCLFLAGGNDSYNMLVPKTQQGYNEYVGVRGLQTNDGLALAQGELLPILPVPEAEMENNPQLYGEYGIHHELPILQTLYNQGNAAFVSNVGTLVEPTTLPQYKSNETKLPLGLFSHSDEQLHWQTMVPQVRGSAPKGWTGRVADCMAQANETGTIAMNVSLSGTNVMQSGFNTVPYITGTNGSVTLAEYETDPTIQQAVDSILGSQYRNLYASTLSQANRGSIDTAIAFQEATTNADAYLTQSFPTTNSGSRLKAIAKIIAARTDLSMNRQIFFLKRGGWDMHKEVISKQESLYSELNASISAFWNQMVDLGLENDVVLFTASDFGRTLTSNGFGSDHAWGGNHFVVGGGINGGRIYGTYPQLVQGGDNDVGRGRLLPTTSVDEYSAELASWFGVPPGELRTVLPNAGNFFTPEDTPFPLGMLG